MSTLLFWMGFTAIVAGAILASANGRVNNPTGNPVLLRMGTSLMVVGFGMIAIASLTSVN